MRSQAAVHLSPAGPDMAAEFLSISFTGFDESGRLFSDLADVILAWVGEMPVILSHAF